MATRLFILEKFEAIDEVKVRLEKHKLGKRLPFGGVNSLINHLTWGLMEPEKSPHNGARLELS